MRAGDIAYLGFSKALTWPRFVKYRWDKCPEETHEDGCGLKHMGNGERREGGSNCSLLLLHGYSERGSQTRCTLEMWQTMDTIRNKRISAWSEGKNLPRWGGETLGTRPKRRWDLHLQRYSKAQGSE